VSNGTAADAGGTGRNDVVVRPAVAVLAPRAHAVAAAVTSKSRVTASVRLWTAATVIEPIAPSGTRKIWNHWAA
jgi:hypothetical protein